MTNKTTRLRLFLYTSIEEYEDGDAARSVLVTGDLSLGSELLDFFGRYPGEPYVIEVRRDPKF